MEAKLPHREIECPTRWDALPERRLSPPYVGAHATCYVRTHATCFGIVDSLDELADLGFHFVCYGPTGQNQNASLKYDMKCLWANRTCDEYITAEDHLTPMTTEFIGAAEDHQITFGTRIACPTCPGN